MSFSDFKPHPLIPGGHLQTLTSALLFRSRKLPYDHLHLVECSGGDRLTVLENCPSKVVSSKERDVLLIHGLGASAHESGVVRHTQKLLSEGYRVFRMNHRGIAEGKGLARGIYHGDRFGDVARVVEFLLDSDPNRKLVVVGYSMSANMVLKLLGRGSEETWPYLRRISKAICISPAIDMKASARATSYKLGGFYNRSFVGSTVKYLQKREQYFPGSRPVDSVVLRTLPDVDREYISREAGYEDVEHYYESCSPAKWLKKITSDTVILCAEDDPIAVNDFPSLRTLTHIKLHVTKAGGHLAFLARKKNSLGIWHWMDDFVLRSLQH
jgi:predicted alpha/beta-fold hydrolase